MSRPGGGYEVRPFPTIRRAYVDVLREGHRHHVIHGLVEVDVTLVRAAMHEQARDATSVSLTAFVVAATAAAVDEDRMLHAHRWGRRKLVLFDDVDVNLQLEQTTADGTRIVQSRIVRAANHKTAEEISTEILAAQVGTAVDRRRYRGTLWFVRLPLIVRGLLWRAMMASPWWTKRFGGTIAVSSVGMFGDGPGWGIPISPAPLMVTVGGIGVRPVIVEGHVEAREHLSLTISVDHDIVDGAPAARFAARLRQLIERAHGLADAHDPGDSVEALTVRRSNRG